MRNTSYFPHISKPGRYLGNEYNSMEKEWSKTDVQFALTFPDLYEIGMSHLGLQILYHILNKKKRVLAERCFCPDVDAEKILRQKNIQLHTLESGRPLHSFDVVGITLPFELCYTNILTILSLSNIPFYSKDRTSDHPLILGGGSCSLNPEPVADFFDAILLGDGEEGIVQIADVIAEAKHNNFSKDQLLQALTKIDGVYIPSLYSPEYNSDGTILTISPQPEAPEKVTKRTISNLDCVSHLFSPLVPNARIVHDRLGVEIARGCTRGCRFCQAGMIYRPVRERNVDQILELVQKGVDETGFEEVALLSLSTGDYSCIENLLPQLMDRYAKQYVSVSMPSMRVGTLSQNVMDQIKRVRKTGFTVAPEAGSDRLRRVINKGITEDDLLDTCRDAFSLGWNGIKLYFMIGLPTETDKDVTAIAELSSKTLETSRKSGGRSKKVTTSVGTFVPKPHTPFQWERQISLNESREKFRLLKKTMPSKGCKLKYHDPEMSFLEGVFSRGDRKLSHLIEYAWKKGARLDSWSDYFDLEVWLNEADRLNMDLSFYLRQRQKDELLPWDHLSCGIDQEFLLLEHKKALEQDYTPDCRYHGCQKCGLCDFSTIKPIIHMTGEHEASEQFVNTTTVIDPTNAEHHKYMVHYSRRGPISYLGHLEILQLVFRALRRAKIEPHYSKGFNPSPKISFGGALPVGMESDAEYFIIDLPQPLEDPNRTLKTLNECLPMGITITSIEPHSGNIPQSTLSSYTIGLPRDMTYSDTTALTDYMETDFYFVERKRKGKTQEIDIKPLIRDLTVVDNRTLHLKVAATAGKPGVKIHEALSQIFGFTIEEIYESTIIKTSWKEHS